MAKIIFEYSTIVQKEMEIPDDIYNVCLNGLEDSDEVERVCTVFDGLWRDITHEDEKALQAFGIYTTDGKFALAEY